MAKTLFDKVWDAHVVEQITDGPSVIYIDKHYIHEVTTPQAFAGLDARSMKVWRPDKVVATADHNVPTLQQHLPIKEALSRKQVDTLIQNCKNHNIELYGLGHPYQGIVHVIGPELGFTQPGMTIVCGDSHTSTHGAFGAVAFGIGTSEVEHVLATQCILQTKPKTMRISIEGTLAVNVSAKDIILYVIAKISASGGTGYFVEYAGSAIRSLSMEQRMTICNMSIEMGARGGMIAPDDITFSYMKGRKYVPQGNDYENAVAEWKKLFSDDDAVFDKEIVIKATDIAPMITYGTNPGMGIRIGDAIPRLEDFEGNERINYMKSLDYMGLTPGQNMLGQPIDYVFLGSCTNSRIEDIRSFAAIVKGKNKADGVTVWVVPGSQQVAEQAHKEGLADIIQDAGITFREPGCSACLAMNEDKVPAGKYCVSTSNRNFEGRQGPGSRTFLASPETAAKAAITGIISL